MTTGVHTFDDLHFKPAKSLGGDRREAFNLLVEFERQLSEARERLQGLQGGFSDPEFVHLGRRIALLMLHKLQLLEELSSVPLADDRLQALSRACWEINAWVIAARPYR